MKYAKWIAVAAVVSLVVTACVKVKIEYVPNKVSYDYSNRGKKK